MSKIKSTGMGNMKPQFSLAYLTVPGCTPPEMTYIAADAGYDFVSLRLIQMGVAGEPDCDPCSRDMVKKTKAALRETGLEMLDMELAKITSHRDPKSYVPAMEAAAELGARHLISSAWTIDPIDRNFVIDRYSEICDLAQGFGLTVDLEFPSFSRLQTLAEATDIVRAANRPNGGILVDTLYCHFSDCNLEDLAAIPRDWIHFVHLCDTVPDIPQNRQDMIDIARENRLYVGEGCIDFAAIIAQLPKVPFSIELPNANRSAELGHEGHARRCLETARSYFNQPAEAPKPCKIRPTNLGRQPAVSTVYEPWITLEGIPGYGT
jgi:sugar phosphate isomerase/epimerase